MLRKLLTPLVAVTLLLGVVGCSTPIPTPTASAEVGAPTVSLTESTIVLDVRTPEEYAAGHLDGAVLLDLNSGAFANALPDLDPSAEYLVYCRSGNRSAQAVTMMVQRSFDSVVDLGAMGDAAAATGLAVVTE